MKLRRDYQNVRPPKIVAAKNFLPTGGNRRPRRHERSQDGVSNAESDPPDSESESAPERAAASHIAREERKAKGATEAQ